MQATTILARPAFSSRAYVTTGNAAEYAGCSRNTIKALLASGELQGYQTEGGHWRVSTPSLLSYVDGIEASELVEETTAHKGVVIYARVSSDKQKQAGSLTRQIERLRGEVSTREGVEGEAIPVYEDCASAFGNRDNLNRLVDAMLDGQVKRIYAEYYDRISRVPALSAMIEHLARRCGVEIICLDVEETDPTEHDAWIKELISYITVVSNRVSAAKSRKVTVKAYFPHISFEISHEFRGLIVL
ncbi:MAG: recombinase family protein [Pirellulales bacterium]|nr:recombinase family protein [Pirellulales bacterium]